MAKFRTPKNDRTAYIYHDAYGRKTEIVLGMNSLDGKTVTANHIIMLHENDDAIHNAAKKDDYHDTSSYEWESIDEGETFGNKQIELADYTYDPETVLIEAFDATERSGAFRAELDRLTNKQRDLIMKKLLGRTNVDIAKEENCTEAAVRNRLTKIQKRFAKFLN